MRVDDKETAFDQLATEIVALQKAAREVLIDWWEMYWGDLCDKYKLPESFTYGRYSCEEGPTLVFNMLRHKSPFVSHLARLTVWVPFLREVIAACEACPNGDLWRYFAPQADAGVNVGTPIAWFEERGIL